MHHTDPRRLQVEVPETHLLHDIVVGHAGRRGSTHVLHDIVVGPFTSADGGRGGYPHENPCRGLPIIDLLPLQCGTEHPDFGRSGTCD